MSQNNQNLNMNIGNVPLTSSPLVNSESAPVPAPAPAPAPAPVPAPAPAPVPAPVPAPALENGNVYVHLTVLENAKQIITIAGDRGIFKTSEMYAVGSVYNTLTQIIESNNVKTV
tara:strand:+ start:359 stop:703 length:345 start_codon:yes stop_codon:yes gene_type:complete